MQKNSKITKNCLIKPIIKKGLYNIEVHHYHIMD